MQRSQHTKESLLLDDIVVELSPGSTRPGFVEATAVNTAAIVDDSVTGVYTPRLR